MDKELLNIFTSKETWNEYHKFQDLENSIQDSNDLYQYIDEIIELLSSSPDSVRLRSFRVICQLAKWDDDNKINSSIDIILNILNDSKPTVVRQCLSYINNLLLYKPELSKKIEDKLKNMDCNKYNDNMRPLIKKDINYILNHL